MAAKNDPRLVAFKGQHPFFLEGTLYSYNEYADYTQQHCELGGVIRSTMKGRLRDKQYCEPKHLKHVDVYTGANREGQGWCKELREKALTASRLETQQEVLSMKWLKTKLIGN